MSAHTRRLMGSLGLLLEADGSSIPSTASDYTPVPRETEDQRRERLAAGLDPERMQRRVRRIAEERRAR